MNTQPTPAELPDDAVEMGRISGAWGIKGWIKVLAFSAGSDALMAARTWYLQPPVPPFDRGFKAFTGTLAVPVSDIKPHADSLVALCAASTDRTAAEGLRGARIFMSRSEFPATTDPDEYYWVDLLGLRVANREGVDLGVVKDLIATGAHSVLVIEYPQGDSTAERMIPFVSAYVDSVDTTARLIQVDWQLDYE